MCSPINSISSVGFNISLRYHEFHSLSTVLRYSLILISTSSLDKFISSITSLIHPISLYTSSIFFRIMGDCSFPELGSVDVSVGKGKEAITNRLLSFSISKPGTRWNRNLGMEPSKYRQNYFRPLKFEL
ncbi:unnamed protein product [Periconia digitata]|uniref:Uncharacterized protein n=1 Tax=Periconia digitata TaxID=1303443 RepID=A0A9W4UV85_9PLEO|nr:unnamed protein product [Periconia digitata]